MTIPENTAPNYQLMTCPQVWELHEKETKANIENTLYWLRIMNCTEQLNALQARTLAGTFQDLSWSSAFKRDILINKAGPSVNERNTMVKQVDRYYHELPHTLLPVIKLWREQQVLQLLLIQEKVRYQHLQLTADIQIDRLKEHEIRLQHKLTNLTDIEHQLSVRKQLQHENTLAGTAESPTATTIPLKPADPDYLTPDVNNTSVQVHSSLSSDIE